MPNFKSLKKTAMKSLLFIFLLAPALVFAQQNQILPAQEFKTKITDKAAVVLDVRTPGEFKEGHLDKALNKNVNDSDFESYCTKLDKGKTYFVYCLAGKRSHTAAETMRKKGLTVFELKDGINGWNEAKLPVVK
jgi:rhodanese-related sulfurtransferase